MTGHRERATRPICHPQRETVIIRSGWFRHLARMQALKVVDDRSAHAVATERDREVNQFIQSTLRDHPTRHVRSAASTVASFTKRSRKGMMVGGLVTAAVALGALLAVSPSAVTAQSSQDADYVEPIPGVDAEAPAVPAPVDEVAVDGTAPATPAGESPLVIVDGTVADGAVGDGAVVDAGVAMIDPATGQIVIAETATTPSDTVPAGVIPEIAAALAEEAAPIISDLPTRPEDGWPVRSIRFPVAGPISYYADWGACRGGTECPRHHMGNDIIGVRLQPLLAAANGTISHIVADHPTAGWGFVITDAEGWDYRYYHVNNDAPTTDDGSDTGTWRFAEGLTEGSRVKAGEVIAFMGDSGNAESSVPHVHFEIHRPDGDPVDPHVSLRLAEWVDSCLNRGASAQGNLSLFPGVASDSQNTAQVAWVLTGKDGKLLVDSGGGYLPIGTAGDVGDVGHQRIDPSCDRSYGEIIRAYS